MTRKEFMIQYVLNRALTQNNLNGPGAAQEASKAWTKIILETRNEDGKAGVSSAD